MSTSTFESFRRMRHRGFSERFYELFLASSPRIAQLFARTDFSRQRELLEHGIMMLLEVARGSAMGRLAIERLARLHGVGGRIPVSSDLYPIWLDAFFRTARECDPEWSDELETSWRVELDVGIRIMRARALPDRHRN